jgi:hypothetical protein
MIDRSDHSSLASAAAQLVQALGGHWHGQHAMCCCPAHEDRTPSLSVRIGDRSLLFKCFAGCSPGEILRAIRQLRLKVPVAGSHPVPIGPGPSPLLLRRIRALWAGALPVVGTPAERYLCGRGLASDATDLRYHPSTPLGSGRDLAFRPALLAGIRVGDDICALHRIFLASRSARLAPDLPKAKLTLGRPLAGAVQLAPPGRILGLAEGIETSLAASVLLRIPVWSVLGAERLHRIAIPATVRHLVLLPDNDRAGCVAAERGSQAYAGLGFKLHLRWPWGGLNDWNDVLMRPEMREGKEDGDRVRMAA